MRVEVLFVRGCPNHDPAVERVREVAASLGLRPEIREIVVESLEDARRLRFIGSPTIRVDGEDLEPEREGEMEFGMSCRLYDSSDDVPSGVPSEELVRAALLEGARR